MKIAFVTRSLAGGGAERVVSVLASRIANVNCEKVFVISVIEDLVTYPLDEKVCHIGNKSSIRRKIPRVFQRYMFLKREIKRIQPDVIISFCTQLNIYSILACGDYGEKLIISERSDPNNDPVQAYVRALRNIIYRRNITAVFQTPEAQKYFAKIIKGTTTVIQNPIKEGLPLRYEGTRGKKIVTVARLEAAKNLGLLIRAFSDVCKEYPEYNLEIYGEGPERGNLELLIEKLKMQDKIFLMGFVDDVHEKIKNATCFVLSSNYEGISNAMIESMALGIPTVCTDCPIGGSRMQIIHGINGFLVPVGDKEALANAMKNIISDKALQNKISIESTKIRNRLSAEKITEQWLELIYDVYSR